MPRIDRMGRWLIVGAGLLASGCDPGHKQTVRDKGAGGADGSAWTEPVVNRSGGGGSSGDPESEKNGIFGNKRLQGGLDDTSRDIERSLGVH